MDALTTFTGLDVALIFKIPILLLIFLYVLFTLVVFNKVRSLGKMVFISHLSITITLDILAFVHFGLAVSLFFISLVIL